jgi:WD40 repeat protein
MGDSDDEETAMLRAMRSTAARMDARGGGGGMQALLDKQRRAQQAAASRNASFFDDDDAPSAAKKARTRSPPGRQEGRPEPLVLEPAADEDAALRAMFPGGFGAAKKKTGAPAAASNRAPSPPRGGPARPPPPEGVDDLPGPRRPTHSAEDPGGGAGSDPNDPSRGSESDSGDDDAVEEHDDYLPLQCEAALRGHAKIVTALAVEHTGSRLLTGSHDYTVKIYDFAGMRRDLRAFREITPSDGYPVHALSWSPSGDRFLVVTGSPQPKLYDRDGRELGELDKGDMYIRDLKNTKGHCSPCTSGQWHPTEANTLLTSGADGSMRLWDAARVGDARGAQRSVVKPQLARPGRVRVTACAFSPDGAMIAGGVTDGSVQIFPASGSASYRSASVGLVLPPSQQCHLDNSWSFASRAKTSFRNAHPAGETITSVAFSRDGRTILSRCGDGTLRVWDVRKADAPVRTFDDLETQNEETCCAFSPNEEYFFTGVDAPMGRADRGDGALVVFDKAKLEMVRKVGTPGNCVAALWHPRLNQVFLGCGDAKGGETRGLYDATRSQRGLLTCVGKKTRLESTSDFVSVDVKKIAYTPHALPMFREPMPGRKADGESLRAKRKDAVRTKIPQPPVKGVGVGGALGGTNGTLLTQHIMKNSDMLGEKNWRTQDPREAILRHAKDAEENPWRTKNAYAETQPEPIFHESEDEEEED